MKFLLTVVVVVTCGFNVQAQPDSVYYYYNQGKAAHESGDETKYLALMTKAYRLHPYHPNVLYHLAMASSVNNKPAEATRFLRKALNVNAELNIDRKEFDNIRSGNDFRDLVSLRDKLSSPIVHSDTAFIIKDKTLHIESIAAGEKTGLFYCGSIHKKKIIKVDEKGNFSDFVPSGEFGLTSVFGIKVDRTKKTLWTCSSPMEEMEGYDSSALSGVIKFDLTGKLLKKFSPSEMHGHVFGDLTLDHSGVPYVSDSRNNVIFKVNESEGRLEKFFTAPDFWNLQGITFSKDDRYMFIADYIKGIFRLDMKSKELKIVNTNFEMSVKSVDGLTFYNNTLIAIQNSVVPMRVTQYILNKDQDALTGFTILDRKHPAFNEPTIGCLEGNTFYYVANSLWSGYEDNHQLKPEDQLQDVVVLKVKL
jgi:sugar lactone lactonase YvrE